ncbi:MAG: hypothetical protein WKG01_07725 [Kofleriaceae bacterium]
MNEHVKWNLVGAQLLNRDPAAFRRLLVDAYALTGRWTLNDDGAPCPWPMAVHRWREVGRLLAVRRDGTLASIIERAQAELQ